MVPTQEPSPKREVTDACEKPEKHPSPAFPSDDDGTVPTPSWARWTDPRDERRCEVARLQYGRWMCIQGVTYRCSLISGPDGASTTSMPISVGSRHVPGSRGKHL